MMVYKMDADMDSRLELEKVDLIFENCEYVSIPAKQIRCLIMRDEYKTLSYSEWNKYHEFKHTSVDCLQIYKKWLKENYTKFTEEIINKDSNVYDRLVNYSDITSIELFWIDESNSEFEATYYVPWNDESEYENTYQVVKETDEEYIEISILTDKDREKKLK